jgi:hypothetical protein
VDIFIINMIPQSLSGETNQDSEPNLSINPANPQQIAATAFTPDPLLGNQAPIFVSSDGGQSWALNLIVPGAGTGIGFYLPTADITLRFGGKSNVLYAGIIRGDTVVMNILRTANFLNPAPMTLLEARGPFKKEDQPWVTATTAQSVPGAPDRVYVGNNDFNTTPTGTVDLSLNAATAPPPAGFAPHPLTARIPAGGQNGPSIRPVVHPDGTVYVGYFNWLTPSAIPFSADVVMARDDHWGQGATPFADLLDADGFAGVRLAQGVQIPWANFAFLGQNRVGSHLAVAVDPRDSSTVYIAWADFPTGVAPYSIHLRRSVDRGVTWSGDLRLIPNGINPALAINAEGHVGFLYQTLTNSGATWETHIEISRNGFAGQWWTAVLASTPANAPAATFQPYLGDYVYLEALGRDFFGVFSASNTPDKANFPNGVTYQRNANFTTKTLLNVNNLTPVPVSIDPFFFKITVKPPRVATVIANSGSFSTTCLGDFVDQELIINNAGFARLVITNITSSLSDFEVPVVAIYPLEVEGGDSIDIPIRFRPTSFGPKAATLTIFSNDPTGPHTVAVSGLCGSPRLALLLADTGEFGRVCVGSFADAPLILSNSGVCPLSVTAIVSSAADFLVPEVLAYPLSIAAGSFLPVPIRFKPASFGAKAATITVSSNDPASPQMIGVSGYAPSGKLAITGSTIFGGVPCGCRVQRVLSVCNVGGCELHVTRVGFKRKRRHFRLINNPFPATLHPGSCLDVVIQYIATEVVSRSCELIVECNDPHDPVRCLDVIAWTIRDCCGEKKKDCCGKCECECCCGGGRGRGDEYEDDDRHEDRDEDGE